MRFFTVFLLASLFVSGTMALPPDEISEDHDVGEEHGSSEEEGTEIDVPASRHSRHHGLRLGHMKQIVAAAADTETKQMFQNIQDSIKQLQAAVQGLSENMAKLTNSSDRHADSHQQTAQ